MPLSRVLFDDTIELHLDMERVAIESRATIVKLLQKMEQELIAKVANGVTDWSKSRINAQLKEADLIINQYYSDIATTSQTASAGVAQVAASATADSLVAAVGGQVAISAIPTASYLETLAGNTIIQGAVQADWWDRQAGDTAFKFQSAVRQGLVGAETTPQIVKRVRNVMDLSKRNAETLVHTSVQSVANTTREKIFADNDDVMSGKEWSSALDRKTCPTCGALDGKRWTTDGKPIKHSMVYQIPPKHFRCRCSMVPVLKTWKELGINMDELSDSTRASMEGQVTDKTFADWLKRKTETDPTFADRTLGKGRAELWRNGKITMDQMISGGKPLSLSELKAKYGQAIPVKALPNVSDSFIIPKSGRAYNASKITLAEIDKIHSIENLPVIPIKDSVSVKFQGQYSFYANRNRPIDIKLSKVSVNPEMTLAHEIGHFIDNQVIPKTSGYYSSISSPIMEEWRLAIANSSATMNLKSMVGNRAFDQKKVRYYLSAEEQWARSYAQWVGQKSGNITMMNQAKAITEYERNEPYKNSQWATDDFSPIGVAIDNIFKKLGWLK